jgi:hypothetical protein
MSNQEPPLPQPTFAFDQIVKGNVCIKKLKKKHMYRITFSKIGKFLVYQVWDKDNVGDQNSNRNVFRLPAIIWINDFIQRNKELEKSGKPLFTPTTIIETVDEEQYACVIHKAYFNSDDRAVFTISTKEIQLSNNCSKKLIKIPCGKFYNMRFDIDAPNRGGNDIVYNRSNCSFPYYMQYSYGGNAPGSSCRDWLIGWDFGSQGYAKILHYGKGPNGEPPGEFNFTWKELDRSNLPP